MSILMAQGGPPGPPRPIRGQELLGDDSNTISGVMFCSRRAFLEEAFGAQEFYNVLIELGGPTMMMALHASANENYPFRVLVEIDKVIYARHHRTMPHILEYLGAASAELGITRVYSKLDTAELLRFLEKIVVMHKSYGNFGTVAFERTATGARMSYAGYPCYSPFYCATARGFFLEAILQHGGRKPSVREPFCHCNGDLLCVYELTWSQD